MSEKISGDGRESSHKRPLRQPTQSPSVRRPRRANSMLTAQRYFFRDWWPLTSGVRSPRWRNRFTRNDTQLSSLARGHLCSRQSSAVGLQGNVHMSFSPGERSSLDGSSQALRWWILTPITFLDLCRVHGLVLKESAPNSCYNMATHISQTVVTC